MQRFSRLCMGVSVFALATIGGCDVSALIPAIPLGLSLGNSGSFEVDAGQPTQKTLEFTVDSLGIDVGSGAIDFDMDAIRIEEDDTTGGKSQLSAQQVTVNCLESCNASADLFGLTSDDCDNVCNNNVVDLRLWVNTVEAVSCGEGDAYRALFTLDDSTNITGIAVNPDALTDSTIALVNTGSFGICFQVTAPLTGRVIIDEMTVNVRP